MLAKTHSSVTEANRAPKLRRATQLSQMDTQESRRHPSRGGVEPTFSERHHSHAHMHRLRSKGRDDALHGLMQVTHATRSFGTIVTSKQDSAARDAGAFRDRAAVNPPSVTESRQRIPVRT